ncbi:MAG: type II/IV secretion system protein [Verrucomicrobia bacterium]|nr:type II/IV secretion system protein [Verrucomicrobiota bacterium]
MPAAAQGSTRPIVGGVVDRLLAAGLISDSQLQLAMREQRQRGGRLSKILVELGFVTADQIAAMMGQEVKAERVDLKKFPVEKSAVDLVPIEIARRFRVLPLKHRNGTLVVAFADPSNVRAIDTIRQLTGLHIEVVTAPESEILARLDRIGNLGDAIQQTIDKVIEEERQDQAEQEIKPALEQSVQASENDAPIIGLVNQIITRAVNLGASDIHFEPEEKMMRVRMRLDGVLHQDVLLPSVISSLVTARLKIMAEMDVAESRVPQDGRATVKVGQREVNLRVSSLPTAYGENMVLRILDPGSQVIRIDTLGMTPVMENQIRSLMDKPHGVIIVTGPTGSGKTTTLYAILRELCTEDVSIFTLEDPIEYKMPGLRQTQIKEEVGLTFSAGLRALLRQDPDIILVGETRDTETAQLMVRAALTGHLVFTTLHTNDAPGAVPRLLDMGVEPYLLPDSLLAVLAQRLVRKICDQCRKPEPDPERIFERLRITPPQDVPIQLWRGSGCAMCKDSGYKGRQGVFELMVITDDFHDAIVSRRGAPEFYRLARQNGMKTMFEDGLQRALQGVTTLDELLRVTRLQV